MSAWPTHVESVSDYTAVCDLRQKIAVIVVKVTDKEAAGLKSSWTAAVYPSDRSATVTLEGYLAKLALVVYSLHVALPVP